MSRFTPAGGSKVYATKDWVVKVFSRADLSLHLTEIVVGCQVTHPYIAKGVACLSTFSDPSSGLILLVTPRALGNLAWWMSLEQNDIDLKVRASQHLLTGVGYLHSLGIAHLDIKPENVLVYPGPTFKLTDFGSAKFIPEEERVIYSGPVVTSWWRPPELWLAVPGETTFSFEVDVWSLGMVMYCLLTQHSPPFLEYLEERGLEKFDPRGYVSYLSSLSFPDELCGFLEIDPRNRFPRLAPFCPERHDLGPRSTFFSRFEGLGVDVVSYASYLEPETQEDEAASIDLALMIKRGVGASEAILQEATSHFGGKWDLKRHALAVNRVMAEKVFNRTIFSST